MCLATCPTSPGERRSALADSLVLCRQAPGGTLRGAGGDEEGGLWGQHRRDRSGSPT